MYPTKTYKLDLVNNRIVGNTDGADAYWQSMLKALSTEKYYWLLYDQNYGIRNMQRYIGKDIGYITAHLLQDIKDCVMTDDRTIDVTDLLVEERTNGQLYYECVIWSVYGKRIYKGTMKE